MKLWRKIYFWYWIRLWYACREALSKASKCFSHPFSPFAWSIRPVLWAFIIFLKKFLGWWVLIKKETWLRQFVKLHWKLDKLVPSLVKSVNWVHWCSFLLILFVFFIIAFLPSFMDFHSWNMREMAFLSWNFFVDPFRHFYHYILAISYSFLFVKVRETAFDLWIFWLFFRRFYHYILAYGFSFVKMRETAFHFEFIVDLFRLFYHYVVASFFIRENMSACLCFVYLM